MNGSLFGEGTVNKLDMLLGQIEDIKKSVVEMDADLFSAKKVSKKSTRNFLQLVSMAEDSLNDGLNLTSPPSPTLEWDSNDIIASPHHEPFFGIEPLEEESFLTCITADRKSLSGLSVGHTSGELQLESPSPSSGKGSMVSSPGYDKDRHLQQMVQEAQKSGMMKELLAALLMEVKRDSAYYED